MASSDTLVGSLPVGPDVLRVTTFNILAPVWTHSSVYPGMDMSEFDPTKRGKRQLEVLKTLDSDIILMQECQKSELDQLLRLDGGHINQVYDVEFCPFPLTFWTNWLTDATNYEPRQNGVCVLTRRATLKKLRAEHLPIDLPNWQHELPEYALGAHACLVTVEVPCWGGAKALIVTSHLDADSAYRAGLQGTELARKLGQRIEHDCVIWGGDFNMEHRHPALRAVEREGGLQPASGLLGVPTVYAVAATVRVDHVFCSAAPAAGEVAAGAGRIALECLGTFVPRCPMGHTFAVLPCLTELQWIVCSVRGERGWAVACLTVLLLILLFPVTILILSPLFVHRCGRRRQCERLSWALEEWGSDHLPVTVSLKKVTV
uniref:Endonuclease/exonuclease/phosphatase domain-containing protein n=1 Tax=Pyrodinium bahamense TaxID=73915 RepID=A0A7S0BB91_9DINO|mmetsp:Transcript_7172/g.19926  ORF Transcript_7172/g.19926 Transcript_7172/m.19926 type:complete len:374 (+) Transcript_7172:74-1195(+)|eukprot:CAMPEP_0179188568 /NCGR_PEP_ID=MMETSP0796-20121207/93594_1 /TAXON_ID=73915 /ORGANISM="Pyrodinium bahamense, Strain pbaha01" /LENGTH=373 /DNA_ID=CAMNT_0020892677 /DNA_START=44 /DNA_END=1165 /DNA_ORIENTATION=-